MPHVASFSTLGRPALETYALVADAVAARRPIFAYRENHLVVFCPHVLGHRALDPYVLGFGYFEVQPTAHATACSWRWIPIGELEQAEIQGGFWLTAPRDTRPSLAFLDSVDVDVEAKP